MSMASAIERCKTCVASHMYSLILVAVSRTSCVGSPDDVKDVSDIRSTPSFQADSPNNKLYRGSIDDKYRDNRVKTATRGNLQLNCC